jgi:hypothetical protein
MEFAAFCLDPAQRRSPGFIRRANMKIVLIAAGASALLLAGPAFAGAPSGAVLGSALPIASVGLLSVAAVSLIAGIRMLRRKQGR